MTEENKVEYDREELEHKAELLGVKFSPNISDAKLAERIKNAQSGEKTGSEDFTEEQKANYAEMDKLEKKGAKPLTQKILNSGISPEKAKKSPALALSRMLRDKTLKKRVMVTCNDPAKRTWQGEMMSVSNSVVGDIRCYVPFNVEWHLPEMMIDMLKEKTYTHHYEVEENGKTFNRHRMVPAFNVTVLEPLSEKEREAIAQRQLAQKKENTK